MEYQTLQSRRRKRRVVARAEVLAAGDNPRFVLTNLPERGFRGEDRQRFTAARRYEEGYCGRGERENGLKQQVLDLSADRLSTHPLGSHPLRLWPATLAYLLLERLRRVGLRGSALARATVGTIRTRLLKVAASLQVSGRRVWVRRSSACPLQVLYRRCARAAGVRGGWSDVGRGKAPVRGRRSAQGRAGAVSSKPAANRAKGERKRSAGRAPRNLCKKRRPSLNFDPKIIARASVQRTV